MVESGGHRIAYDGIETYNYERIYWSLFIFALILMAAGFLIEVFYYYIPRMESAKEKAAESIVKSRKDLAFALVAANALPKSTAQDERERIETSKVLLEKAESMYSTGGYLNPDIFRKAESQAEYADMTFERIKRNSTVLGHTRDRVMTSAGTEQILTAVADYCNELESAYPRVEVPKEIADKASGELLRSADTHYAILRAMLDNNKAWERDLTENQNTTVDLMSTGSKETEFLDRMTKVCRKTKQKDAMIRLFYLLFKASREGEFYRRVRVRPDTETNLLDWWASDLDNVKDHNTNIEADLTEAESMLAFMRAE